MLGHLSVALTLTVLGHTFDADPAAALIVVFVFAFEWVFITMGSMRATLKRPRGYR